MGLLERALDEELMDADVGRDVGGGGVPLRELRALGFADEIDLVSEAERAQFAQWNATAADIPTDVCIHQLFVERALEQPHSIAVRDADGAVTYEEVFRRALALSRTLRELGVNREELVGVRLPKG